MAFLWKFFFHKNHFHLQSLPWLSIVCTRTRGDCAAASSTAPGGRKIVHCILRWFATHLYQPTRVPRLFTRKKAREGLWSEGRTQLGPYTQPYEMVRCVLAVARDPRVTGWANKICLYQAIRSSDDPTCASTSSTAPIAQDLPMVQLWTHLSQDVFHRVFQ
jgi:hypothetical protein